MKILPSAEKEWESIQAEMAKDSKGNLLVKADRGSNVAILKKGGLMKEMEQVLHELKEELSDQEEALANYQAQDMETDAEWITEGWTEALTFAIRKIEEAMKQSQEDKPTEQLNEDKTIEWADRRRQELEGVGLSDAQVQIIREIYEAKTVSPTPDKPAGIIPATNHDDYMEGLNELHRQARRHLRGKIEKN